MSDYWKEMESASKAPAKPLTSDTRSLAERIQRRKLTAASRVPWVVAGVSAVNLILVAVHSPIYFAYGLMSSTLIMALGIHFGIVGSYVSLVVNASILGLLVLCGFRAAKSEAWAFYAAIGIVALDTLVLVWLYLKISDVEPLQTVLHALAIYYLITGLMARKRLLELAQPPPVIEAGNA